MTDTSPAAVVERRLDTLRALATLADSKAGLVKRIGVSRSTVDRSLHELATHGFVQRSTDGYRLTPAGRAALAAHARWSRRIDAVADAATLLDGMDLSFDLDPAVFDGARVIAARPHAPHRPVECVAALVGSAAHVSVYAGRLLSRNSRLYHDRVPDGMTGTLAAAERVIERQRATPSEDMREAIDLGRIAVRRADRVDPVTLILAETPDGPEVGLVVYRDETPYGFVGTDDLGATRWARDLYERLWSSATPI